jgi:hypothetical protein
VLGLRLPVFITGIDLSFKGTSIYSVESFVIPDLIGIHLFFIGKMDWKTSARVICMLV